MKILLALICFVSTLIHAVFGYYLYERGEKVFEPEGMVVAVERKSAVSADDQYKIFRQAEPKAPATETHPVEKILKPEAADLVAETEPQTQTEVLPFATGWSGFLQVENALITTIVFFLGLGACFVKGRGVASRWVFGFNLVFWSSLGAFGWLFKPVHTPMNIFRITLTIPEINIVLASCAVATFLSLILFLNAFRKPVETKGKVIAEPEQKPSTVQASVREEPTIEVPEPIKEEKNVPSTQS